ncbi:MAG TPA: hydroxymethylglutaryl-CoA lyase [bacterium]|nr:hydroxymethylglutaryl-CoA lyase [bacterium]
MRLLDKVPRKVRIVEVGPRDGLQNEPAVLPVDARLAFIEELAAAGLPVVEVGAFVRSDRVPQMAGTDEIFRRLPTGGSTVFSVLVPNTQGMVQAAQCGAREVAVFTAASEAFVRRNINMTIDESLRTFREVIAIAKPLECRVRGYVSTAWWCPYAGRVTGEDVRRVAVALYEMGCYEIALGDTIGAATPGEVIALFDLLSRDLPPDALAGHFHDTRGTALANVLGALECGIGTIDASAGGLGGCPFAPGASGNLATEDLLYMLHGMGIETGVDLPRVARASGRLAGFLDHPLRSRYLQGGSPEPTKG